MSERSPTVAAPTPRTRQGPIRTPRPIFQPSPRSTEFLNRLAGSNATNATTAVRISTVSPFWPATRRGRCCDDDRYQPRTLASRYRRELCWTFQSPHLSAAIETRDAAGVSSLWRNGECASMRRLGSWCSVALFSMDWRTDCSVDRSAGGPTVAAFDGPMGGPHRQKSRVSGGHRRFLGEVLHHDDVGARLGRTEGCRWKVQER